MLLGFVLFTKLAQTINESNVRRLFWSERCLQFLATLRRARKTTNECKRHLLPQKSVSPEFKAKLLVKKNNLAKMEYVWIASYVVCVVFNSRLFITIFLFQISEKFLY